MKPEQRFVWIRHRKKQFLPPRSLSKTTRGCMTGRVTEAIRSAADNLHLPVSNARDIRLELALAIFERPVATYNELTDAELWALDQWTGRWKRAAISELKVWLEGQYGSQPQLI